MNRSDFWPTGWLVWASIALGGLDLSLLAFIISKLTRF